MSAVLPFFQGAVNLVVEYNRISHSLKNAKFLRKAPATISFLLRWHTHQTGSEQSALMAEARQADKYSYLLSVK